MPQERPHSEFNIDAELARQEEARKVVFGKIKQDYSEGGGELKEKKLSEIFGSELPDVVREIFGENCLVETDLQGNIKKIHVFAGMSECYIRQEGVIADRFRKLSDALNFLISKVEKNGVIMHAAYPIEGVLNDGIVGINVTQFANIISREISDLIQVVGRIPIVTTKLWAVPNGINEGGDLFQKIGKSAVIIILRLLRISIEV